MAAATDQSLARLTLLLLLAAECARGFPSYQGDIPNGFNVVYEGRSWPAVGHRSRSSGSGPENPFGVAFANAGYAWTQALCEADSDDDGQSNGQELGDPNCTWTPGQTPARTQDISHPGFAEAADGSSALDALLSEAAPVSMSFIGGLVVVTMVGLLVTRICGLPRKLLRPCLMGWSATNLVAVAFVVLGLAACSAALSAGEPFQGSAAAIGTAAGLAAALPVWWAFLKGGVHELFGVSREAAWRIHIAFGNIALLFGLAHGLAATLAYGATSKLLGLGGLALMLLGTLPAALHRVAPRVVTYDRAKLLHFLSLAGYMLTLGHMLGFARDGSAEARPVFGFNALALLAYAAQRVYVACRARRATPVEADVITEQHATHVALRLKVPGFKYAPGQWCRLRVPSVSAVAHPFTLVPDELEDHVRLFVKVSGRFTAGLAAACQPGAGQELPAMYVQGPFGTPALPASGADAAVFVLGGVGVTPALSLVAEARRTCGEERVRVYWATRSAELLGRAAPLLEQHLKPGLQCVRLTQAPEAAPAPAAEPAKPEAQVPEPAPQALPPARKPLPQRLGKLAREGFDFLRCTAPKGSSHDLDAEAQSTEASVQADVECLPLGAEVGREDVGEWIAGVASNLATDKVKKAMLFVCGPRELVSAAQRAAAASEQATGVSWHLHVETFEFLPAVRAPGLGRPLLRLWALGAACRCPCRRAPPGDGANAPPGDGADEMRV